MQSVNYVIKVQVEDNTYDGISSGGTPLKQKKRTTAETEGGILGGTGKQIAEGAKVLSNLATVGYARQFADTVITAEVNRVDLRTGHALLQQKISWGYSTAKNALSTVGMLTFAACTGNPIAGVGAAVSLANTVIQRNLTAQNLRIAQEVEDVQIRLANIRAGAFGTRNRAEY